MKVLTPYAHSSDLRGSFTGITIEHWSEVNFIETSKGEVRGNHYHKETVELFFIITGEIEIDIMHIHTKEEYKFIAKKGDIFVVLPYEVHTFKTLSDSQWINMLSKRLDPKEPDFHRYEARLS